MWREKFLITCVFCALVVTACEADSPLPTVAALNTRAPVTNVPTRAPTSTPTPLAASVNSQPIFLAEYEAELKRYEAGAASVGLKLEANYKTRVLEALIDKSLMIQAANAGGIKITDAQVQEAYTKAVSDRGGDASFAPWLAANFYTPEQFLTALRESLLVSGIQTQIAASVAPQAEQVHARHILVATQDEANKVLTELKAGGDFTKIAIARSIDQSRVNGGDLGWFAQTSLTVPEVAQAAFSLQPKQTSGVVKSALGFHIIQTLERGVRPLSSTALAAAQQQALNTWLAELRSKAAIQKFVTTP